MLFTRKYTKGTANKNVGLFRNKEVQCINTNMSVYHIAGSVEKVVYMVDKLILVPGPKNKIVKSGRRMYATATVMGQRVIVVDSKFLKMTKKEQTALYYYGMADAQGLTPDEMAARIGAVALNLGAAVDMDTTDAWRLIYAAAMCGSSRAAISAIKQMNALELGTCKKTLDMYVKQVKSTGQASNVASKVASELADDFDDFADDEEELSTESEVIVEEPKIISNNAPEGAPA